MDVIGLDIGFGFTKATNGTRTLAFKSVYGEATDIPFRERLLGDHGQDAHLHIELDGHPYFVGELAERQSDLRYFTLDQDQLIAKFVHVLAMAALSQLVERNIAVNLVTGLPVGYYSAHKDALAERLQGRHPVTILDDNGNRTETVVSVGKVRVIPQPFGSLFNLLISDRGQGGDSRFMREKIGIIDIGFRTADYIISHGTRFSGRGHRTTDAGISHAFNTIAAKLHELSGVDVELYRLYQAVAEGSIRIRGKQHDIRQLTEQVFGRLAATVAAEVNRLWADDWDMDSIVLSGGGGAVLAPYLTPLLQGNVLTLDPGNDARMNNVRGYWKYGCHLWNRQRSVSPAPSIQPAPSR